MKDELYPKVTAFTLVYNSGKYVIEAIQSLIANQYPNLEHIIIDDCSTDGSAALVDEWIKNHHYSCTFIKHSKNQGICKSLNEVLSLAKGEFMFGISDDLIHENYISVSVDELQKAGNDYCLSFCNSSIIDENGVGQGIDYYGSLFQEIPSGYAFNSILKSNFINGVGALYRRKSLIEVGGFDESLFFEDWDMHIRLLKVYRVLKIEKVLTQYRRRSSSISSGKNPLYYESLILICIKVLKMPNVDIDLIKRNITDYAEFYFKAGGSTSAVYKLALVNSFNKKTLTFTLFNLFRLDYQAYVKMTKILN